MLACNAKRLFSSRQHELVQRGSSSPFTAGPTTPACARPEEGILRRANHSSSSSLVRPLPRCPRTPPRSSAPGGRGFADGGPCASSRPRPRAGSDGEVLYAHLLPDGVPDTVGSANAVVAAWERDLPEVVTRGETALVATDLVGRGSLPDTTSAATQGAARTNACVNQPDRRVQGVDDPLLSARRMSTTGSSGRAGRWRSVRPRKQWPASRGSRRRGNCRVQRACVA